MTVMAPETAEIEQAAEVSAISFTAKAESPYSLSFKSQRGTLITVRGDTPDELAARLTALSEPLPPDASSVLELVAVVDAALSGAAASQGGGQQQQQQSLTPKCETCGGATVERSGTNARGAWKGYFCQVDKDHKPKFVR